VIAMFVVLTGTTGMFTGTTGMFTGVAAAAGEEIGWRAFLVPELAKVLPFTGVALVSGLIWAAWHYPSRQSSTATPACPLGSGC
jgi:uncharacterized protein